MKDKTSSAGVLAGALLIAIVSSIAVHAAWPSPTRPQEPVDPVYTRVISSGKIRAGYVAYPPGCIVDPGTGEPSGIFVEILEQVAKDLDLELEYVEEVGWGTMIEGLKSNRYDIMGSPAWANPVRGKLATLSDPVYFSGVGIWVRYDETRFIDGPKWASINDPIVRIAAMDGSTPEIIARTQFPRAKLVSYPDLTGEPQLFLDLVAKKVDVFFAEPTQGMGFLSSNPGQIKNIASDEPIKIFANVFLMPGGEFRLKGMIDTAIDHLQHSGFIDRILSKYEPGPNAFYREARPYQ